MARDEFTETPLVSVFEIQICTDADSTRKPKQAQADDPCRVAWPALRERVAYAVLYRSQAQNQFVESPGGR